MIKITNGDIFKSKSEAIVNTINCVGVMGKGIALTFKKLYPHMFTEYVKLCKKKEIYIGRLFIYEPDNGNFKYVINFPTKTDWRCKSKIEDIEIGLEILIKKINQLGIESISLPALGCNCGGLKWTDVMPIMLNAFSHDDIKKKVDVYIYRPLGK